MTEDNVKEEATVEETEQEMPERPEPPKDENGNPCPPPHHGGPHGPGPKGKDGERPEPPKDENGNPCPPPHHGGPHGPRPDGTKPEGENQETLPSEETAEA